MLKENEFKILNALRKGAVSNQRELADMVGLSLGTTNTQVKRLSDRRYLKDLKITTEGLAALQPYKVDNAVILAAGFSSRFAPISYERPKGSLTVRGEVLIERTIRQLQEVGVTDISVVVGYMKEQFFYLEEKFGARIVVGHEYDKRNNHSSIKLVEDRLANTYVVYADNYFTKNVFEPYVYHAYYGSRFFPGPSSEWGMITGANGRVVEFDWHPTDRWCTVGEMYFDREFSRKYVEILNAEYDLPETAPKLVEQIIGEHLKELALYRHDYPGDTILEFDTIEDLRSFDPGFIDTFNSFFFNNICDVLGCMPQDITDVSLIKKGANNMSFAFSVNGARYVYRHPVALQAEGVDRTVEHQIKIIARELNIDDLLVSMHPTEFWKISRFVAKTREFDYGSPDDLRAAFDLIRPLHTSGRTVNRTVDYHKKTQRLIARLKGTARLSFPDFAELDARNKLLHDYLMKDYERDSRYTSLQHHSFFAQNLLIDNEGFHLIDWEYASMGDYATDLAGLLIDSGYNEEQIEDACALYLGHEPSPAELRHCLAFISVFAFYWFLWSLDDEERNGPSTEPLDNFYRCAKIAGKRAEALYRDGERV
jgi:CTP:phosphocholine cytidylyltransferase-like protein/thiamine kinase-like enzyme